MMNLKVLLLLLLFPLLSLNNCSGSSNDDENEDNDDSNSTLSLNGECYSCTSSLGTNDGCGDELISGASSTYEFSQSGTTVTLNIADQIELTGTYTDGAVNLSLDNAQYRGPDCDSDFSNIEFTVEIETQERINIGWVGTLSYDINIDTTDDAWDSFSFNSCHAEHSITCQPSGC